MTQTVKTTNLLIVYYIQNIHYQLFNLFLRWIKKAQVAIGPLVIFAAEPPGAANHYAHNAGL